MRRRTHKRMPSEVPNATGNRTQSSVFLIVLAFIALGLVLTAAARGERLPIKSYSLAEGMVHGQITTMMQDSQGFIWFCTYQGISRFDGYGFTNYGTKDGLPYFAINDLKQTRSGTYWLATNGGGICRFNPRPGSPASDGAKARSRFKGVVFVGPFPAALRRTLCSSR
jgi:ligand-binding sensor domain-containing protein